LGVGEGVAQCSPLFFSSRADKFCVTPYFPYPKHRFLCRPRKMILFLENCVLLLLFSCFDSGESHEAFSDFSFLTVQWIPPPENSFFAPPRNAAMVLKGVAHSPGSVGFPLGTPDPPFGFHSSKELMKGTNDTGYWVVSGGLRCFWGLGVFLGAFS